MGAADSDRDGVSDGAEDGDGDGKANEDADDTEGDACDGGRDGDGETDEDEGDRFGTIESFDADTGTLVVVTVAGEQVSAQVTADTEIAFDDGSERDEQDADTTALVAGVGVAELEFDRETGQLDEIELL